MPGRDRRCERWWTVASQDVAAGGARGSRSLAAEVACRPREALHDGEQDEDADWADAQRRLDALELRLGAPVEAQLAEVDLGIVPAHPLWGEVMTVLSGHGGNFVKFFKDMMARVHSWLTAPSAFDAEGWPVLEPHPTALGGTGPP